MQGQQPRGQWYKNSAGQKGNVRKKLEFGSWQSFWHNKISKETHGTIKLLVGFGRNNFRDNTHQKFAGDFAGSTIPEIRGQQNLLELAARSRSRFLAHN